MPEYFTLPREDQHEALLVAAERSGRPLHLLEKDVWVVWALQHLFTGPHAQHLVFKGGTSLSKAYGVIKRFSEDVDLTYDIRAIAPDLIEKADSPWPVSYTHLRAHETVLDLVCRLLLEKKNTIPYRYDHVRRLSIDNKTQSRLYERIETT